MYRSKNLPYHCCIYPSNLFHTHHLLQPTSPPGTLLIHQGRSSGSLHRAITQTSKHLFFGATGFRMDTRNLDTTSSIFTDGYDPPVLTSCQTIKVFEEKEVASLSTHLRISSVDEFRVLLAATGPEYLHYRSPGSSRTPGSS